MVASPFISILILRARVKGMTKPLWGYAHNTRRIGFRN